MNGKNWYKIETIKEKDETYHYVGTSLESLDDIVQKIQNNQCVRLDDLIYMERGSYKEWSDWDKTLIPSVVINPSIILTVMQFKSDPRV